jgi:hypothetical protein
MEQPTNTNLFDLQLDQSALNFLNESARWARFLSIIGFISCGLMVVGSFFGSAIASIMYSSMGNEALSMMGGGFIAILYLLVASLVFFPSLYLFRFSSKMRKAFRNNDQVILTDSLKNLKSFFKFYGICTVVILSFYALIIVAAIIGAMVGRRH